MKKNKSIDGLEIRDAKNLAPTSATPIKVTAKSSKAKVPVATKPAVKTTTKPVVKPAVKKVKTTNEELVITTENSIYHLVRGGDADE